MMRLMGRKEKRVRSGGYMTVSVALVLVLGVSLCLTLIEGSRRSTTMLVAQCAVDTGMNSILAEYHRELLSQYGLFFIDTSYGSGKPGYRNTLDHLEEYVKSNLGHQEVALGFISEDFIDLYWDEGEILGLSVSSDQGGAVLRRQISEYMKEQLGISYLEELLEWMDIIEDYELTGDWYAEMKTDAAGQLQEWEEITGQGVNANAKEKISYCNELLKNLQEETLNLLLGLENLSDAEIEKADYLTGRELLQGTGMNPALEFSDNDWDRLLLYEYILQKTGHYGEEKVNSHLQYQTEYILYGMESDVGNISEMVDCLFAVRETANAVHILLSQEKMDLLKAASDVIASALGAPECSLIFQTLFVVIWAGFESLWDVSCLLEGEEIGLIKNNFQWHYDVGTSVQETTEDKGNVMLGYDDYLRIFLMLQDTQLTTYRLMDVIEMDIRLTPGNEEFRMDGCIDSVTVCIDLESGYGYQFEVTRNYGY